MEIQDISIWRLADHGRATGYVKIDGKKLYLDTLTAEGLLDQVRPIVEKLQIEERAFA